jgi:hypothetical protein
MPDVLIHRCMLRVIRRGGWSWGAHPKRVAEQAVAMLPELLAKRLAELMPEDEEWEYSAPVCVRVRIRMSELMGTTAGQVSHGQTSRAGTATSLEERLDAAIRAAFGVPREMAATVTADRRLGAADSDISGDGGRVAGLEGGALCRLLLHWREHGVMERRLAVLDPGQAEVWHEYLRTEASRTASVASDPELSSRVESGVQAWERVYALDPLPTRVALRMLIAAEVAAELSLVLTHAVIWKALDCWVPVMSVSASGETEAEAPGVANSERGGRGVEDLAFSTPQRQPAPSEERTESMRCREPREFEVKVGCAVPFLLLGPLARMGYLAALAGVLEAAKMTRDAPLFAVALAYKILDPPERGWLRTPASLLAAAASAGLSSAVDEERLAEFARCMSSHTSALDVTLADALIAGHTPGDPVSVCGVGGKKAEQVQAKQLMVVDSQGCFPLAWAGAPVELTKMLGRLGHPVALISPDAAQPELLRELDEAGVTFVVGVPPTRSERWQRVMQGGVLLGWTNSPRGTTDAVRKAAQGMCGALEEVQQLATELVERRPAVTRAQTQQLDRSLTLATSVAMATIAWKLWQKRGRTCPLQVLERFADLDARVRFTAESVRVSLPLGRRHDELREGGLLQPVSEVPWFPGRRIYFTGG